MKYTLFHNQDALFFRPGSLNDFYIMGYSGSVIGGAQSRLTDVLEAIFVRHNRDDRPDGRTRPSLSVGDVIVLTPPDHRGEPYVFTVDMIGWKEL